jgi:hypothetical protein
MEENAMRNKLNPQNQQTIATKISGPMEICVNNGCSYYSNKRKNKCKKIAYKYSVNICECHSDDDGYSLIKPKGESPWPKVK